MSRPSRSFVARDHNDEVYSLDVLDIGGEGVFYSGLKYFGTGKECQPTLNGTAKKLIVRYNSIIPSPSISIEEIPFKYCRIPSMFQFHRFW